MIPGGFGVTVFFFLSGYLITTLLRQEYQKTGDISLRQFYLRRVYRILPPMYIVLVILMLPFIDGSRGHTISAGALTAQFLQFTNYYLYFFGDDHAIPATGPMWSLAIEEHFYLIFPFALLLLLRRSNPARAARVLMGACAVVLAWRCFLIFGVHVGQYYSSYEYTYVATDTRVDSLLYGCIMALCLNPVMDPQTREIPRSLWIVLLSLSVALLSVSFLYRGEWARETVRYSVQGLALIPVFFCAIRYSHWYIFRWLNWSWVRGLGMVSYTFYLVHLKSLEIADRYFAAHKWVDILAGWVLAVAFSALMYFTVEKRFARLRRQLHDPAPAVRQLASA